MSLKEVLFLDDDDDTAIWGFPSLLSGCPVIEHLSIDTCKLGYSTWRLEISSDSLKSLKIMHCHSSDIYVTAKSLEAFTYYSDCTCRYHKKMYLWECDSLNHLDIFCKGLKLLLMHNCLETMENSFCTPNLDAFEYSGYLKTKVRFVEAPLNFVKATIRVWETEWPTKFYSAMRDFLESFDCSKRVKIHITEPEGVLIPENRRAEWTPPLPGIKQLQLYFPAPVGDIEYCMRPSLIWMAPSAEILPFLIHDDDDEYDTYDDDDDDDNVADVDNDNDDDFGDNADNIADEDNDINYIDNVDEDHD
ncbi:uncharacterized protein LOC126782051 [Argentina anserina]|uniref:uncharacterized protein LOC126782051 n=1 Tax=Argentina anserina TaxID=57926 RepID=UPI00217630B3|nr:uncharacterized protein LOC126782051 [Potentilla anserina]